MFSRVFNFVFELKERIKHGIGCLGCLFLGRQHGISCHSTILSIRAESYVVQASCYKY